MSWALGVDLGTSNLKVVVVDAEGTVRGMARATLPASLGPGGAAEQDAGQWWTCLGHCARAAVASAGHPVVRSVGVTAQYSSVVVVDRAGNPLTPVILWMDQRGVRRKADRDEQAHRLAVHGLPAGGTDDLAHISYLRATYPDECSRGVFVEPVDALVGRICGRVVTSQHSAFALKVVDNRSLASTSYAPRLLAWSGLDEAHLAPLVAPGGPAGPITAAAAEHLGIDAGATVAAGTIDSLTSAVGCGVVDGSGCAVVIGTTAVASTFVDTKREDLANGLFSIPAPIGGYLMMAEAGLGGRALDHLLHNVVYPSDALALGEPPDDAYERAERAAASVPAGAAGVLYQPWLAGSMAPRFAASMRGGFVNIGLATTRAEMARAVYEGVALGLGWVFPAVRRFTGRAWPAVRFGGGGAASPLWARITADVLGVTVEPVRQPGVANARGAALLALVGEQTLDVGDLPSLVPLGVPVEPDPEAHAVYAELVDRLAAFHSAVEPFYASFDTTVSSS